MAKSKTERAVNRRGFLKGAATAAPVAATDAEAAQRGGGEGNAPAPPPTAEQVSRDAGNVRPASAHPGGRAVKRPGSDLMVQVLRDLGVEYVAANPGSSFEGLQES